MVLKYFMAGIVFTFFVDVIISKLQNHPLIQKIGWGNGERIACILIWPICLLLFIHSFIKETFK